MHVSDFASTIWSTLDVRAKTLKNYMGAYERYLQPVIGEMDLLKVDRAVLAEALLNLPRQTKYQTLMTARVIFREAVDQGLTEVNPAALIKPPKINVQPMKFLTWEELKDIDFGYQTERIRFLALHGLRFGEAAVLGESDVRDGRVFINKSKYGLTKTSAGVRSVPQMAPFVNFPMYQNRIADALAPYGVNVHSLRKTYAYLLKSSGVHVTTACKLMGHSNPMITLKIYTLVRDEETDVAGEALSTYINLNP